MHISAEAPISVDLPSHLYDRHMSGRGHRLTHQAVNPRQPRGHCISTKRSKMFSSRSQGSLPVLLSAQEELKFSENEVCCVM
jgi:hypothetical protein